MTAYFVMRGTSVFATRIKQHPNCPSKTCMVGASNMKVAQDMIATLAASEGAPLTLRLEAIDTTEVYFQEMLRLNGIACVIADSCDVNDGNMHISGDVLFQDEEIGDDNRRYLDLIYNST